MTAVEPPPIPMSDWVGDYTRFPHYHGLRVTIEEYNGLQPDGYAYEVVDGIMTLMPDRFPKAFYSAAESQYPKHISIRCSAEEYLALPDDGYRYELIDGVVIMSPSPTPLHQAVMLEIAYQIKAFLKGCPIGRVLVETDVVLTRRADKSDLVYRPELVFYLHKDGHQRIPDRLEGPPDLVVEVQSPATRRLDLKTKHEDYEAAGVPEYWLFDPEAKTMLFLRLTNGHYTEMEPQKDVFTSEAVPGFRLNLADVRAEWTTD